MGSVFSHHSTNADRSAGDRRRHKNKIEKAIKEGIHDIVAEESIIGQNPIFKRAKNILKVTRKRKPKVEIRPAMRRVKNSMK